MTVGCDGRPVPAAHVGVLFVNEYYKVLCKEPQRLRHFYKEQSVLSWGVEGAGKEVASAVGSAEIHDEILRLTSPFEDHACKVEVFAIESQESKAGGIIVFVTGRMSFANDPGTHRHFNQVFFLDRQTTPEDGYYVLNDILRYVAVSDAESESSTQPWSAEQEQTQESTETPAGESLEPTSAEEAPTTETEEEASARGEDDVTPSRVSSALVDQEASAVISEVGFGGSASGELPCSAEEKCESFPIDDFCWQAALEEEQPRTWASMARQLGSGTGSLKPGKAPKPAIPNPGLPVSTGVPRAMPGLSDMPPLSRANPSKGAGRSKGGWSGSKATYEASQKGQKGGGQHHRPGKGAKGESRS